MYTLCQPSWILESEQFCVFFFVNHESDNLTNLSPTDQRGKEKDAQNLALTTLVIKLEIMQSISKTLTALLPRLERGLD